MSQKNNQYQPKLNLDEFLYKKQFQRKMSPAFLLLDKLGFFLVVGAWYLFDKVSFLVWILSVSFAYYTIYKKYFNLNYYEFEELYLIKKVRLFLYPPKNKKLNH